MLKQENIFHYFKSSYFALNPNLKCSHGCHWTTYLPKIRLQILTSYNKLCIHVSFDILSIEKKAINITQIVSQIHYQFYALYSIHSQNRSHMLNCNKHYFQSKVVAKTTNSIRKFTPPWHDHQYLKIFFIQSVSKIIYEHF